MNLANYFLFFFLLLFSACTLKNAEEGKIKSVTIYTDSYVEKDNNLFQVFEKSTNINVHVYYFKNTDLIQKLKAEKYNSKADLLVLSNYESIRQIEKQKLFLEIKSEVLNKNIDKIYRSSKNNWFALSKSPLVIIYNSSFLKKDTIKTYHELLSPKWKSKICLQDPRDLSYLNFAKTIKYLLKNDADTFLLKLNNQSAIAKNGDDFVQIDRVNKLQAFLSVVKLASLAEKKFSKNKKVLAVNSIFPNQRKKGCYITISGAGVYRYAQNPLYAQQLLEFLSSKKAQKIYAQNRFEYPVTKNATISKVLIPFGKYRGRFYKY